MSKPGLLIILSSPSGGGKTTLCSRLCEMIPSLQYSISVTTRSPRPHEVDGKDYIFVSEEEFFFRRQKGDFIEWARVHNNYYGTPYSYVYELLDSGKDVILDIDPQGAAIVKEKVSQGILIFVLPPSLDSLAVRLQKREPGGEEMINERLSTATQEINQLRLYDYVVVNKDIEEATAVLQAILTAERWRTARLDIEKITSSNDFEFLLKKA